VITAAGRGGLTLEVRQSFGNCPQYIQTRAVASGPASTAPAEAIAFPSPEALAQIARADTMFVATNAGSGGAGENGGVDISHRGGLPGFVKVDGDVLTIPDFRGNRFFNTLGNLTARPARGPAVRGFRDRRPAAPAGPGRDRLGAARRRLARRRPAPVAAHRRARLASPRRPAAALDVRRLFAGDAEHGRLERAPALVA
jgi:hypothetical protein